MGNRRSRTARASLTREELESLQDNTGLSIEEINTWYEAFLDSYPSGQISLRDLKDLYEGIFFHGNASRLAEYMFRTFQKNENGKINFAGFLEVQSAAGRVSSKNKLLLAFSVYDLDGNGYITRQNMLDVITAIYEAIGDCRAVLEDESSPELKTDKIFRQMDKNRDGKISYAEFSEGAKENPTVVHILFDPELQYL